MKKTLALILAAVMIFLTVGCTQKEEPTPTPDTDATEQDNAVTPEQPDKKDESGEERKTSEELLDELRARPLYTETETIRNGLCYVIRGYFSETAAGITDDIYAVYHSGELKNLYSPICTYFAAVDSISFTDEDPNLLIVNGLVPADDGSEYIHSTAELDIKAGKFIRITEDTPTGKRHSYPAGADPECLYDPLADTIFREEGTFSEGYIRYMDGYHENEEEWEYARPALLWYLAQKMGLTREDFETYYASFDFSALGCRDEVPENIYEGLMADTLEESMQLLKSDYAFYNDGKLYTVYDIYEMYESGTLPFDITDSAYDEVWKSISNYLEMQKYEVMPREAYLFVRERAHDPVNRIYFFLSPQYQYNICEMYFSPDIDYYSILDCDNYEVSVDSMNARYAIVRDGTYFIYDYLNGEKVCDIPLSPDEYSHIDFVDFSSADFPQLLEAHPAGNYDDGEYLQYDTEKQEFVSYEQ